MEDEVAQGDGEKSPDCVRQVEAPRARVTGMGTGVAATPCDERHPFVCRDLEWTVDPGTGHAYRVFLDQQAWIDAHQACERIGGHLATLTSAAEQDLVSGRVLVEVWIGVTDAKREASFTWVTSEPFAFANFAHRELESRSALNNDCVVLGPDRFWHDRPCSDRNYYLCEIDR